ncbi:MAG: MBL fold metallo-hydrolase [Gammaproteobacteria bacterium]|nr:MBL fold metallo-hydrolase [Gammaproteobacteria bacterium]MBU2059556.1 MBL fold metallo-hydrolase [Gammaproteobacteria bacterium]MBU2174403.1 MBL fold metallo-hydrolase [Gammaproteobacteria bacterium]MBU2248028.1 MBL fold metallo-hydrolase [Gammaproteobacteria bacterium]MBU2345498.1 MBL fold metallo-hydrolase [Gammaproteobacteria bacterium]
MQIKFYGVRGSVPTPGPDTQRYGGNTPCVLLTSQSGQQLILDSGTGIRQLGHELMADNTELVLLLSHNHWDHIQGFPFFAPAYQAGRKIRIIPGKTLQAEDDSILKQMCGEFFPVAPQQLASVIRITPMVDDQWQLGDFLIHRCQLNHPGAGSAYRIQADGQTLAYVTDNELFPPGQALTSKAEWLEFVCGVDLLIHDGQYLETDMPHKEGWGHSMVSQAVTLATEAGVKNLVIFSHDPTRTDEELDRLATQFSGHEPPVLMAMEGMELWC